MDLEGRIPAVHSIRKIGKVPDQTLGRTDDVFEAMSAERGCPYIPLDLMLRWLVVQMIHTIRSGQQLM